MRSSVSSGGSQSSGAHQESCACLGLALEPALLHQVEHRGQQAEAERGIGHQQRGDVSNQPACPHAFRGEICSASGPSAGHKDQEERRGQSKDSKGDSVVEPPDQEEQARDRKAQQRLDFAHAYRHPAVGLDQHLHHRDKVEEKGHSAQVDADLPPAIDAIEHGREDGDTRRRVKNSRNSEPEKIHFDLHLKALVLSIL